jgi:hypothetical protein
MESVATLRGIGGNFRMERVATFARNTQMLTKVSLSLMCETILLIFQI